MLRLRPACNKSVTASGSTRLWAMEMAARRQPLASLARHRPAKIKCRMDCHVSGTSTKEGYHISN